MPGPLARMKETGQILVTGGTGFVGSAVIRALLSHGLAPGSSFAGARVRALVREGTPRANLDGLPIELVEGDLRDASSLERAMRGVDALFHVAADYRLWAPDPEEIVRNNLSGTRNIMEAALRQKVARIVYTSSVATLAPQGGGRSADETCNLTPERAIGAYKRSKVVAERLVQAMVMERGLPAIIVNPSTPIGPRDIKPTPTGRVIVEAANGRIPAYVDTSLNLAHVDDVAAGHLAAFEHGRIGELYILGGENVGLARMLGEIAHLVGRRAPLFAIPRAAIYPVAVMAETLARFTGREPFVTRDALRMAKYHMRFTSAKAERDLGYRARPFAEGLADAIAWFRQAGYVR
jgi:dihydroflavonol-4-reductase